MEHPWMLGEYKHWFVSLWIALVAVIAALVAWAIADHQTIPLATAPPTPAETSSAALAGQVLPVVEYLPSSELPIGITADMPLEQSATVLQNYETHNPGNVLQKSARQYLTAKTLAQAYADYVAYFQNNGWVILAKIADAPIKFISAKKDLVSLQIIFGVDGVTHKNSVNIMAGYYAPQYAPGISLPIVTGTIPHILP